MTCASHYEKHLLYYLGLSFDPDRDYAIETNHLIGDLIRYRGRSAAIKAIKAVIGLVSRRVVHGHPDRVEGHRQRAYLAWLRTVRERLNDRAPSIAPSFANGHLGRSQRYVGWVEMRWSKARPDYSTGWSVHGQI